MTSDKKNQRPRSGESGEIGKKAGAKGTPPWADGLRQLYDSVLDEPLPDTFKDLLSKLDEPR